MTNLNYMQVLFRTTTICLIFFNVVACANMPTKSPEPVAGLTIFDAKCDTVIERLPARLEEQEFPFTWVDESQGLLTVGPITEEMESGGDYSRTRQTYYLTVTCDDEITTNVAVGVELEGLDAEGEWVQITDTLTLEESGSKFLQSLDL